MTRDLLHAEIAQLVVCRARKKLAVIGVKIKTDWGRGYYLDAQSRELITVAIKEVSTGRIQVAA